MAQGSTMSQPFADAMAQGSTMAGYSFYEKVPITDEKTIRELTALYTKRAPTLDGNPTPSCVHTENFEKTLSLTKKKKWLNVTYRDRASKNEIMIHNQHGTQCGHWTHLEGSKNQHEWPPSEKKQKVEHPDAQMSDAAVEVGAVVFVKQE